jgi:hypothetical protein
MIATNADCITIDSLFAVIVDDDDEMQRFIAAALTPLWASSRPALRPVREVLAALASGRVLPFAPGESRKLGPELNAERRWRVDRKARCRASQARPNSVHAFRRSAPSL